MDTSTHYLEGCGCWNVNSASRPKRLKQKKDNAMSTEARLKRLGLWHLHDQPEALSKELDRQIAIDRKERAIAVEKGLKEKAAMREAMEKQADYGKNNVLVPAERAEELCKRKLAPLNSGFDPDFVQAGITLAGYHIEAGARAFVDYAKAMIADLGDIDPRFLRSWYEAVRHYPDFDSRGMTPSAELDALAAQEKVAPVERDMFSELEAQFASLLESMKTPEDSEWEEFENDYPDIAGPIQRMVDARLNTMCRAFVRHYGQFWT